MPTHEAMKHLFLGLTLSLGALLIAAGGPLVAQTETGEVDAASQADEVVAERRARLQQELQEIEQLIDVQQDLLSGKRQERASLERDLAIIEAEIEKAQLGIRARTLEIQALTGDISNKEETIKELDDRLAREKGALAELMRRTNEIEDLSVVELVLSSKSVSDFFEELDDYQAVKSSLNSSFDRIEETVRLTQAERDQLTNRRQEELELRRLQELEKQTVEEKEAEKARLLEETRGEEEVYQQRLAVSEQTAAEIRAALFELRDTRAIKFGDALELAEFAGGQTGVRPALILAILTQETRLGENLGTGNYLDDMHPTRDKPLFLEITRKLGLNPSTMPVSKKPGYGWGGAMGPSQFIPSTWACYGGWINTVTGDCNNAARSMDWDTFWAGPWEYRASEDRLRNLLGKDSPANPWENRDAFMATALLMKDNGADAGGYQAERLAALRYFAGWANATNPSYAFYGDGVMGHAARYQRQIDILNNL
ncbi:hypothetical protein GVX82_00920 [Patescibacteria group bacterium]|jgi:hypothetical protein|nr:hypothetical protein [Patescibacteria group bacterium]